MPPSINRTQTEMDPCFIYLGKGRPQTELSLLAKDCQPSSIVILSFYIRVAWL
ncbi:hypothetical protein BDW74DRAFT_150402 [Aspergillus multicolor]|uniref:uncharacterized protein n=1 Tax=Aspergillus multicolor TaxID=41759 RepID=UPI003CCD671A